jgi:uncharacterized protein YdeI (YjbR/CyaY-like superfamily)
MPDTTPKDLKAALKSAAALGAFEAMPPSHRHEYIEAIEEAKKPETRTRRIEQAVKMIKAWGEARTTKARK